MEENWWIVVGDPHQKKLISIKRIAVGKIANAKLNFTLPKQGLHKLMISILCDSYVGCDQEEEIKIQTLVNPDSEHENDDDSQK